jgi:2,3-bisphosphoglycerate-independent phosphoglycerate mutase
MKCVVVVGDGMADEPIAELGNKTPLEVARTPNLDRMASRGILGLTRTLPAAALTAGDIASLAILGYDPVRFRTGCASFEAAARGVSLGPNDVAFRLNLVTLERREDGTLVLADFAGGRPTTEEAQTLIGDLAAAVAGDGIELHAGLGYRHLLVWRDAEQGMRTTPPYALTGQPVAGALPSGPGAERIRAVMDGAADVLRTHPVCEARIARGERAPNAIWLWGQGTRRSLPALRERFGVEGAVVAAADLVRGIGKLAGLAVVDVPGATGQLDTNFRGKAERGLEALDRWDFLFLHVAAPDEGGHLGDAQQKIAAIERIDEDVLGPLLDGLRARGGEWRVMVMADHPTPCGRRAHTADPVPFAVYVSGHETKATTQKRAYHERDAREQGIFVPDAHTLLERLLRV